MMISKPLARRRSQTPAVGGAGEAAGRTKPPNSPPSATIRPIFDSITCLCIGGHGRPQGERRSAWAIQQRLHAGHAPARRRGRDTATEAQGARIQGRPCAPSCKSRRWGSRSRDWPDTTTRRGKKSLVALPNWATQPGASRADTPQTCADYLVPYRPAIRVASARSSATRTCPAEHASSASTPSYVPTTRPPRRTRPRSASTWARARTAMTSTMASCTSTAARSRYRERCACLCGPERGRC